MKKGIVLIMNDNNHKKYYLGIDGGGTKTALCLIDEAQKVVKKIVVGPSSLDTVGDEGLLNEVLPAINSLSIDGQIVSCFAGLGGITDENDSAHTVNILKQSPLLKNAVVTADNDIINAMISGHGKEEGMVGIIGTGSVGFGIHKGRKHRCGGYSYLEGDYGSSFDLGQKALQFLARVLDGRLAGSLLSTRLIAETNLTNFSTLAKFFYLGRTKIASLAKIVTECADQGDYNAIRIIDSAVEEMMLMFETVYNILEFDETELAIIGSLGNADTYYRCRLMNSMAENLPKVKIVSNKYEPDFGAAKKAYNQVNN